MRRFLRSLAMRAVAVALVVLAASPLTAPFTTCDWNDLVRARPLGVVHVGHLTTVSPETKTPSDPNTTTFAVMAGVSTPTTEARPKAVPLVRAPHIGQQAPAVLRL